MKRFHVHVAVDDLAASILFYEGLRAWLGSTRVEIESTPARIA